MAKQTKWFNWSLRKLLQTESGSFNLARIKILCVILAFGITKASVVFSIAAYHGQSFQMYRAAAFLVVYGVVLKLLLANKAYIKGITHFIVWAAIFVVWSNVFVSALSVNIMTLQFVFMVMISSFYLLGRKYGIIYSILSTAPAIAHFAFFSPGSTQLNVITHEIAPPGGLIMTVLNFITLIFAHYLYHQEMSDNLREKEVLNEQLQAAVAEARKQARAKSDFLSTMSHELRTPLVSVIGISDLLLDEPHSEDQKETLGVLKFSATGLHTLINNILDFNKIEAEMIHLEMKPVNLFELVSNCCSGLSFQAKEKGISLLVDVDEELKGREVVTDPTRITQVIYNLAGNGIKFTEAGSVSVKVKVLEHAADKMKVRFSFTDSGIGIHPEKQTIIFDPFVQASGSTTRRYGGTGLGLPIVKRLLTQLNSDIQLKSMPGAGSEFSFEMEFDVKESLQLNGVPSESVHFDLSGLRVLLAEDNPMNIFLLEKLMSKWNVECDIAHNGEEALEKLSRCSYDLILLDIQMPKKDGYQTAREIRASRDLRKAGIPIIALTASVAGDIGRKITSAGMNGYVQKPFCTKELFNKMKSMSADGEVV